MSQTEQTTTLATSDQATSEQTAAVHETAGRNQTAVARDARQFVTVRPAVRVVESPDAYILTADLPGVAADAVEVHLEKNVLTVAGESSWSTAGGPEIIRRFERSFAIRDGLDRSGLTASMKHGVLTVTLPKATEAKRQRVEVKAVS